MVALEDELANYTSHGPIAGSMPVFGPSGGEIMTVISNGDGTVTIFQEDSEEPGRLNPATLTPEEYETVLTNQP